MQTRKEQLRILIHAIADEMDSLEDELRDYQEQINELYAELDAILDKEV